MIKLERNIDKYLQFWKENSRRALLLTGARQVGKTFSIRAFGESSFENFVELNFGSSIEYADSFARIKSPEDFLLRLSSIAGRKLVPHKTLVFLDEIQLVYARREKLAEADPAFTSLDLLSVMKSMVEEGKYRFVLSGSLLGVSIKNIHLYPVGYLDEQRLYPLTFFEYLKVRGTGEEAITALHQAFLKKEEVDPSLNSFFLSRYREYVLVGGMPEAVSTLLSTQNLASVDMALKGIRDTYESDIVTYIKDDEKRLRVKNIYRQIPSEVDAKNKRFIASHVADKNYLNRNSLEDDYLWLSEAGVAIPVYNVSEPTIPLEISSSRKTLKLFYNDPGLLCSALLNTGIRQKLLNEEAVINYGAPYENAAASELVAHGYEGAIYYYNSKRNGEVDFMIERNGEVLPIEIKSGKPSSINQYNRGTLNNLMKLHGLKEAFLFGNGNTRKESESITSFPIYMIGFLDSSYS